jgi:hypothetical protein
MDSEREREREGRTGMTTLKGEFRDYLNLPKMVNNDDVN